MTYPKSEDGDKVGSQIPTLGSGVGIRMEAAINLFRTKREAADALDISTDQLARYIKEVSSPPLSVLIRLSEAKGVSLDWLATGKGEMRPGGGVAAPSPAPAGSSAAIDPDLYGRVTEAVAAAYKECGYATALRDIAAEAAKIAADLSEDIPPEDRPAAIRGAVGQLRRRLREAIANPTGPAATKHGA